MKIVLSKDQWMAIGKKTNWIKNSIQDRKKDLLKRASANKLFQFVKSIEEKKRQVYAFYEKKILLGQTITVSPTEITNINLFYGTDFIFRDMSGKELSEQDAVQLVKECLAVVLNNAGGSVSNIIANLKADRASMSISFSQDPTGRVYLIPIYNGELITFLKSEFTSEINKHVVIIKRERPRGQARGQLPTEKEEGQQVRERPIVTLDDLYKKVFISGVLSGFGVILFHPREEEKLTNVHEVMFRQRSEGRPLHSTSELFLTEIPEDMTVDEIRKYMSLLTSITTTDEDVEKGAHRGIGNIFISRWADVKDLCSNIGLSKEFFGFEKHVKDMEERREVIYVKVEKKLKKKLERDRDALTSRLQSVLQSDKISKEKQEEKANQLAQEIQKIQGRINRLPRIKAKPITWNLSSNDSKIEAHVTNPSAYHNIVIPEGQKITQDDLRLVYEMGKQGVKYP